MEEAIEEIVKFAVKRSRRWGDDDRFTILNEASQRLMDEAHVILQAQYLTLNEMNDEEDF